VIRLGEGWEKMKANRKFMKEKKAVSAVIGVILMVAITVALVAVLYASISGWFSGTTTAPISITLKQKTPITSSANSIDFNVGSASSGALYKNIYFRIRGSSSSGDYTFDSYNSTTHTATYSSTGSGTSSIAIKAGDVISISITAGTYTAGDEIEIIDTRSNSVIQTLYLE